MTRQAPRLLPLALLAALSAGCVGETPFVEILDLNCAIKQDTFQPGDVVRIEVSVRNKGAGERLVNPPGPENVEFLVGPEGSPNPVYQKPVRSAPQGPPRSLPEGQSTEPVRLYLVRATTQAGVQTLTAIYRPGAEAGPDIPPQIFSRPIYFAVKGPRRFERDDQGLLKEGSALAEAKTAFGKPVKSAKACLAARSAEAGGLPIWWVNLYGDASSPSASYFVDPFTGVAAAAPRPWEEKPEPPPPPMPGRLPMPPPPAPVPAPPK